MKYKNIALPAVALLVAIGILIYAALRDGSMPLSSDELKSLLTKEHMQSIKICDGNLLIQTASGRYKIASDAVDLKALAQTTPTTRCESISSFGLFSLLVFATLILALTGRYFFAKNGETKSLIKRKSSDGDASQDIAPSHSDVRFSAVAGMAEAKEELQEIIDYLKNPSKYRRFGVSMPRGVLLVGPAGVGKTLLAKAVAGEANVPFFYQSAATFAHLYVGVGAKRVAGLFGVAKRNAPAIIFIDELDAVGKARGPGRNDEREATLNQLLTEMDGFERSDGIVVLAATNRHDALDEALTRPGRFDRLVFVDLPDLAEREEILKLYLSDKPNDIDTRELSHQTVGFSGAMLSNLVNEAALFALRTQDSILKGSHFAAVQQKVATGRRKHAPLDERQREVLAIYQACKAVTACILGIRFEKITLTDARFMPVNAAFCEEGVLENYVCAYLAGREGVFLVTKRKYTIGADDWLLAKSIMHDMGSKYALFHSQTQEIQRLEHLQEKTKKLLSANIKAVEGLKELLLAGEHLTFEQVQKECE